MSNYILRRILIMIPTLIGVSILVFSIVRATPGDPVRQMLGEDAPQERVEEVRRDLGLDQPIVVQYGSFLLNAAQGDLGQSIRTRQPVTTELVQRLPLTMTVATISLVLAVLVGLPLGVIAAVRKHTAVDNMATAFAVAGVSIPSFWFSIMAILVFAVWLGWLPVGGIGGPIYTWEGMRSYILPCTTLAMGPVALIARLTRSSMLDVMGREYVTVARGKGMIERRLIIVHALKNAMLPVITYIALLYGFLLGGAVVTETIFSLPGVGRLVITSISARDYPMVQGIVLMIAFIFVVINLVVDVLYAWFDPRISYD